MISVIDRIPCRTLKAMVSSVSCAHRVAEIVVRVVTRKQVPSHLILGAGAFQMAQHYSRDQIDEAATWESVSRSADFGQEYPVDLPTD